MLILLAWEDKGETKLGKEFGQQKHGVQYFRGMLFTPFYSNEGVGLQEGLFFNAKKEK